MNVPLMWAAASGDRSCPLLQWLAESLRDVPISLCGERMHGNEAVMVGWDALHEAFLIVGTQSREAFSEWLHRQGFLQPRWGAHFSGRAQKHLLNAHSSSERQGDCIGRCVRAGGSASV